MFGNACQKLNWTKFGKIEIELSLVKVKFSTLSHPHKDSIHQRLAKVKLNEVWQNLKYI